MSVLRNVKVRWASVIEPNTKFENRWEIEAILDKAQAATLADHGFKLKTDEDGNPTYRFRRKCEGKRKDGGTYAFEAPKVFDAAKKEFDKLIGNGSVCNIQYNVKETSFAGNAFINGDLVAVQVLQHVTYGEDEVDELDVEGETEAIEGTDELESIDEDDVPY